MIFSSPAVFISLLNFISCCPPLFPLTTGRPTRRSPLAADCLPPQTIHKPPASSPKTRPELVLARASGAPFEQVLRPGARRPIGTTRWRQIPARVEPKWSRAAQFHASPAAHKAPTAWLGKRRSTQWPPALSPLFSRTSGALLAVRSSQENAPKRVGPLEPGCRSIGWRNGGEIATKFSPKSSQKSPI